MHIVTAEEMYEIDKWTTESFGLDEKILMENAGRAAALNIIRHISCEQRILVLAGGGNNGGDGFVIARTLAGLGYAVHVIQAGPDEKIAGAAAYHKHLYVKSEGKLEHLEDMQMVRKRIMAADALIDSMLGIGVKGEPKAPFDQIITWINESPATVFSIDIPSGVPAGEGNLPFSGVEADVTVIIEAPKPSAFVQRTASYYGKREIVSIGIPPVIIEDKSSCRLWQEVDVRNSLPQRDPYSHKGTHGKGIVAGGALDMPGSITLSTAAALRAGAGLITSAVPEEIIPLVAAHVKEATYKALKSENGRIASSAPVDTAGFDAVAIGMGMGRDDAAGMFTRKLLAEAEIPVLIDADGLFHIKDNLEVVKEREHPTILTPHPGEMAMLTGLSIKEILTSPFRVSKEFALENNVHLLLKGAFTTVTSPDGNQFVNTTGNAGLAKGGSGDALSGILLAMLMKQQSVQEALSNGCFLHGLAAELVTKDHRSTEDMLASDLIDNLAAAFRALDY